MTTDAPVPAKPPLTLAQKQVIAKRSLNGETSTDLEGYAGRTAEEIRKLLKTDTMRKIIQGQQEYYDEVGVRVRLKFSFEGEPAADRIISRARNPETQEQLAFQCDKYIIDQILPDRKQQTGETRVNVSFDTNALDRASKSLERLTGIMSGRNISDAQYTITGRDGVDTPELDAGTSIEVSGPNSSGQPQEISPTSENDRDGKPEPPVSA